MKPRPVLCLALASVVYAPRARAQVAPEVALKLKGCGGLDAPAVRRILAAELGAKLVNAPGPGVTTAIVVCHNGDAGFRVQDPLSRKVVTRHVNIGAAAPMARARLVAIATSELVLASWSELETDPDPRVEPAGPPPPPAAREAARDWVAHRSKREPRLVEKYKRPAHRPFSVSAVISQRAFFSHPGALWGGGVRVDAEPLSHLSWSLDAVIDRGQVASTLGRYEVETATLGASVYYYQRWSWFATRLGAGLRLGAARSAGVDGALMHGTSSVAPWGWPLAALSLSARPIGPLVFELAGETSYVLLPLSDDTSSIANPSLRGMWYGIEFGIGVAL